MEDPWFGIMSTSRVWMAFIMIVAVIPTKWNVIRQETMQAPCGEKNLLINCMIRGTAMVTLAWSAQP